LENLRRLDFGKVHAAFDKELERVVRDCQDRPADKTVRTVNIKFGLRPNVEVNENTIDLASVAVEVEISSTVPKRRTKVYTMQAKHDGRLGFQPDSPEDPTQEPLFVDKDTGEVRDE
jgi:hypothetical protein